MISVCHPVCYKCVTLCDICVSPCVISVCHPVLCKNCVSTFGEDCRQGMGRGWVARCCQATNSSNSCNTIHHKTPQSRFYSPHTTSKTIHHNPDTIHPQSRIQILFTTHHNPYTIHHTTTIKIIFTQSDEIFSNVIFPSWLCF